MVRRIRSAIQRAQASDPLMLPLSEKVGRYYRFRLSSIEEWEAPSGGPFACVVRRNQRPHLAAHAASTTRGTNMTRRKGELLAKAAEIARVVPLRGEDGGPHPADAYAVERLAEVLCRIELASAHLDAHGLVNKKGEAHSLLRHISRWEAQARSSGWSRWA